MSREFHFITALAPTSVPVPEPLGYCDDPDVIGVPFYVMGAVDGLVLRQAKDAARLTPETRRSAYRRLIQGLVELHAVDPDAVGLADMRRRGSLAERQLRAWGGQWERARTRDLPDMERLIAALATRAPLDHEVTIVHGDYRFDNTILNVGSEVRLAAILDWELATLGDPIADLGMLLTYWHDAQDDERALIPVASGVTTFDGFPTSDEIAEDYAAYTGRDLESLPYFRALGAMKLAVALEAIHARFLAGRTVGDGHDKAGSAVQPLVARGLRQLGQGRD
jgi:aminoglycoside phosphotransferase (APT) family kinase protein